MFRITALKYKNGKNGILCNVFAKQLTATAKQSSMSKSADEIERIVIPKKINRGPTDLLYTLSKTIGRDPTAVHYKFSDDPFLIPYSNRLRDNYSVSKESGRKAAKWIQEEHAELFNVCTNKY